MLRNLVKRAASLLARSYFGVLSTNCMCNYLCSCSDEMGTKIIWLRSIAWTLLGARTLQQLAELLQKRLIQTLISPQGKNNESIRSINACTYLARSAALLLCFWCARTCCCPQTWALTKRGPRAEPWGLSVLCCDELVSTMLAESGSQVWAELLATIH